MHVNIHHIVMTSKTLTHMTLMLMLMLSKNLSFN